MCTGVMDHEQVTHVDLRQLSVNRKFIIVLAQRTGHIINVITRRILLAHYGNMVICAVHCRAHQVDRTCIDTDILLMRMLFIDRSRHEAAIRSEHISSELGIQRNIAHAFRNQHFLIYLAHALCDDLDIVLLLIRAIRDTDSTGKIDESDLRAGRLMQLYRQLKQHLRQHRIIIICNSVARKECMDTKLLHTLCLHNFKCFFDLLCRHAILRITRVVHDAIADLEHSARIVPAGHRLRQIADRLLYLFNMRDIVQIDDTAHLSRLAEFFLRCII